jgi:hypothetical protein
MSLSTNQISAITESCDGSDLSPISGYQCRISFNQVRNGKGDVCLCRVEWRGENRSTSTITSFLLLLQVLC